MRAGKIFISIVFILSALIALATLRIFPLGIDMAFPSMAHQIKNMPTRFLLHIGAASFALLLGGYQILPGMRKRHLKIHRLTGRLYALTVLIGAVSGLYIAFNIDGAIGTIGFALLAILWMFTTAKAVLYARAKNTTAHRIWMIRSFALTFAAVTLRLQLAAFMFGFHMPYEQVYPILAWSCWVPNILFAQWWVSKYPRPVKA
jgi:uncharacterized membrane protein